MKRITVIMILSAIVAVLLAGATQPVPKKAQPKPKSHKPKTAVAAPKTEKPKAVQAPFTNHIVEVSTSYGSMIFRLYNETPKHRDNFVSLVNTGFYDSLLFHRVIQSFMVQGGDPQSKYAQPGAMVGEGEVGYKIPAELNPKLFHRRGALAAARDDNPERASSGCQFYIVQGKTYTQNELSNIRNSVNYNMKNKLLQQVMAADSVKNKVDDFVLRGDKAGLHSYILGLQPQIDAIYKKMEIDYSGDQVLVYTKIGGAPHLDMNYTVFGEMIEGFDVLDSIAAVKTDPNSRPLSDVRMKVRLLR